MTLHDHDHDKYFNDHLENLEKKSKQNHETFVII